MGGAPAEAVDLSGAGARMARRLSAFMRTLQENALAVGLKEGADAARILASPLAGYITGASIPVDGGLYRLDLK